MQVVKELSYIFDKKNKVKLLFLFILILGSAFLELVGVSAIMPLVNIIVDSTSIYNNQVYYAIYSYFGMNNEKQFVMLMTKKRALQSALLYLNASIISSVQKAFSVLLLLQLPFSSLLFRCR